MKTPIRTKNAPKSILAMMDLMYAPANPGTVIDKDDRFPIPLAQRYVHTQTSNPRKIRRSSVYMIGSLSTGVG